MKHLILSGGRYWLASDGGKAWVQALLAHTDGTANIAFCFYAQEPDEWPETLRTNQETISRFVGDTATNFKTLESETFAEVSAWANVIVVVGGDPAKLKAALAQHGNLLKLWDGKTICGSSAGADIMCQKYMYLQDKTVGEGFGWVAANCIPHWQAEGWKGWAPDDWTWAAEKLAGESGAAPLLTIREGGFVEITIQ